jgi:uracil-DNA glycosylase family 4
MGGSNNFSMAHSYFDWWTLAGVDALVGETPAGWLNAPPINNAINDNSADNRRPTSLADQAPPVIPEVLQKKSPNSENIAKGPVVFPTDWNEFQSWLAENADVPGIQWDGRRVLPIGAQGAKLMVLAAWPEQECQQRAELLCGDAGKLLDNMLRAIGLTRDDCYLASMAITRPAGGRCDPSDLPELQRLLSHHIAMAQPQRLLLIGADITQILVQTHLNHARGKILAVDGHSGHIDTIAVPHPALMLNRPTHKAAAWDSLKLFVNGN